MIFKKQKTTTKTTTTVYRLKKKITAFYTTEILSQDFAKQELGSSYFFAVDGESSVVSPHKGECTNLGVLPSILYIFIILIVQNCIIFCNHHVQSVYVFHFNFFNTKRGSICLQGLLELFLLFYVIYWCGNLLLRTNCRQQINFIWTG